MVAKWNINTILATLIVSTAMRVRIPPARMHATVFVDFHKRFVDATIHKRGRWAATYNETS